MIIFFRHVLSRGQAFRHDCGRRKGHDTALKFRNVWIRKLNLDAAVKPEAKAPAKPQKKASPKPVDRDTVFTFAELEKAYP